MISRAQVKCLISGRFLPDSKSDLDFLWSKTLFSVIVEKYVLKAHILPQMGNETINLLHRLVDTASDSSCWQENFSLFAGRVSPDYVCQLLSDCRRVQGPIWIIGFSRKHGWSVAGFHRNQSSAMPLQGKVVAKSGWPSKACAVVYANNEDLE